MTITTHGEIIFCDYEFLVNFCRTKQNLAPIFLLFPTTFPHNFHFFSRGRAIRTDKFDFSRFDFCRNASVGIGIVGSDTFGHFVRPFRATTVLLDEIIPIFLFFAFFGTFSALLVTVAVFIPAFLINSFISLRSDHLIFEFAEFSFVWLRTFAFVCAVGFSGDTLGIVLTFVLMTRIQGLLVILMLVKAATR